MKFKAVALVSAKKKIQTISPFWDKCQKELGFYQIHSNYIHSRKHYMIVYVDARTSIGILRIGEGKDGTWSIGEGTDGTWSIRNFELRF